MEAAKMEEEEEEEVTHQMNTRLFRKTLVIEIPQLGGRRELILVRLSIQPMWKSLWANSPKVGMVYEGGCVSRWLWGLVAPGAGVRAANDTTGSSHSGCPASEFSLIKNIIYLGVKAHSDTHYSSKKII